MRKILTPIQMAAADKNTIASGVDSFSLMQRAGAAVASAAIRLMGGTYGKRVTLVCGKGNNGGDGLVAAGILARGRALCRVFLLDEPSDLSGDSQTALSLLRNVRATKFETASFEREVGRSDLVIDAMVGTGFRGVLKGQAAEAAAIIGAAGARVLAVDIPSGVNGETGQVEGPVVSAAVTVTLAALKPGLVLPPGTSLAGDVEVADIGIPPHHMATKLHLAEGLDVSRVLPSRPAGINKRSAGKVLVVAGSPGMSGAASLSATGALRAGAGLVWLAAPQSISAQLDDAVAEAIVVGLPETARGTLEGSAVDMVLELSQPAGSMVLGPGLSRDPKTAQFVQQIIASISTPVVLDADGINAFEGELGMLKAAKPALVLTPHSGELARLLAADVEEIDAARVAAASDAARATGACVLLKGFRTVVAAPDGQAVVVDTGGPVLATAGSGDVLSGVIAAFLAGGAGPFEAAWAAAWIHGLAGDLLAASVGDRGVLAGDLASALPLAIAKVA